MGMTATTSSDTGTADTGTADAGTPEPGTPDTGTSDTGASAVGAHPGAGDGAKAVFHPGQEVTLVDACSGEPIEIVRVKAVRDGKVSVETYTALFDLTGRGLPFVSGVVEETGAVYDLRGNRVSAPVGRRFRATRVAAARHNIRPASADDRRSIAEREEAWAITVALEHTFREATQTGRGRLPLDRLREIGRMAGIIEAV